MTVSGESPANMSKNLLSELGVDVEDFTWQHLALCANTDTNIFYEEYESSQETARATDEMCLHCPVMAQCFFRGAQGEQGVWGGVYWNGSGKPDKNKNSHKTEEIWKRIYKRVNK